jgi:hypothetical protein
MRRTNKLSTIGISFAVAFGGRAAVSGADPVPGLNLAQTFDPIKQEMASGGIGNIAVIGDSLSFRGGSWLYPFIASMEATYGDAGSGYQGASLWTGGGLDAGWTYPVINTDPAPYHSLDGLWISTTAATDGYLQPSDQNNNPLSSGTTQLQYIVQPGGGTFEQFNWVNESRVTSATISTNGAQSVGTYTFTDDGVAPWYLTNGDGPVTLLGEVNTTGNPGVMISRMANGGWGINDFLQRDWTFDAQVKLLSPTLYFIWLGQNDQWETSASDYASKVEQLVNRLKSDTPDAQFCLVGTYDSGSTALQVTVQGMEEAAMAEDVGFIDLYDDAGNYAFMTANGDIDPTAPPHFSDAGGDYMGQFMFDAFQTDGASLVPEPTSLALCFLPAVSLLMLRRRGS